MRHETETLVNKATDLFWQRGFNATGMRDIQATLDVRPGSFYARFGSKNGLFEMVIADYVKQMQTSLHDVAEANDPVRALRTFFFNSINTPSAIRYKRQCLLIKSLAEIDTLPAASRNSIEQGMQTLKESFCMVVDALIVYGVMPGQSSPERVASWLQNQFVGLRTYACINEDINGTAGMIDKVLIDLQGQWPVLSASHQQPD